MKATAIKDGSKVRFTPTELLDPVKKGGTLEIGGIFIGVKVGNCVWFTDRNDVEWCFYINQTCSLI